MKHLTLHITGMTCGHCENFVKGIIAEMPGTANVAVDHKSGLAELDIDETVLQADTVKAAINETQVYQAN
ncbi:MAG: heavy-metal-associated domain-containing protein [Bacteroidetes bacterium]|nr:heavy-metal-associated domain-containing protein [Bacteroidota bacterium]